MTEQHRLREWMAAADREIQENYAENHAKAREPKRIQQTGHAAERAWGQLLERWLPPQYEIAYRRYILPEIEVDEYEIRETDIVILRPGYPQALRNKEEVLAAGVLAAFSVKLTLDGPGLAEGIAEAANIRRHTASRLGTPRQELTQPFRYGVLSHSHRLGQNPRKNLNNRYVAEDGIHASHPRESLDLVCVADLGVWAKLTATWMPVWDEAQRAIGNLVADHYSVQTMLMEEVTSLSEPKGEWPPPSQLSPLTVFISSLYSFLAQEDDTAEPFYRGLIGSGLSAAGWGTGREWQPAKAYSETTLASLPNRLVNGRDREWGMVY
ncbi:DUF6602 domain-containing protein [Allobranchiibius huperziae]|uniref:DUF6602 domain-containing protein n=1 Tax=Allobranchiibius huperziae TaxID=1874116 RepID=A0A853DB51_9MICO|nr:DUF6602 domain-containing protein [Allobranchiibius huperziae]NYJ73183.1 hypothetical protein [Allobranchiibius huperziae]